MSQALSKAERQVMVRDARGLHARPSARFVECAERFRAEITVSCDGMTVPGSSIMGLLMLGAGQGKMLHIVAEGQDAEAAVAALCALVESSFQDS